MYIVLRKKPKFGSFFTGMSAKRSGDATLRDTTRALALLSTDAAAVKGLQAVIKAGRRQGPSTLCRLQVSHSLLQPQQQGPSAVSSEMVAARVVPATRLSRRSAAAGNPRRSARETPRSSVTRGCGRSFFRSCVRTSHRMAYIGTILREFQIIQYYGNTYA